MHIFSCFKFFSSIFPPQKLSSKSGFQHYVIYSKLDKLAGLKGIPKSTEYSQQVNKFHFKKRFCNLQFRILLQKLACSESKNPIRAVHKALQWQAVGQKIPKIAVHKALQQFRTLLKPSENNVECIGSKRVPKSTYAVQNLT